MMLIMAFGGSPALAWETPLTVAAKSGYKYYKPEIGFAPSGAVHIVYREKDTSGNSDIYMCTYDGKEMVYENVSNAAQSFARHKCYESDIEITGDGKIHVAWVTHDRGTPNTQYVKYRYKDGGTWSDTVDMTTLHMHSGDVVFDLRLGVSSNGNVHIILQEEHQCVIKYVAKYGDTIIPLQNIGNPGSRLKHPDIAVDDNYVHAIWMRKVGYPYVIVHQKWENKLGGAQGAIRQITFPKGEYASQKSRIDLDSDGYLHLAEFYKTGIVKKLKYYKELPGGSFAPYVNLSSPSKLMLYHWAGLEVRDNSIIATMQLGSTSGGNGLFYNWKRNGQWGGYKAIPGTEGAVHQSVDLSVDGEVAAVAYGKTDSAIMLVSSTEITATGTLSTEFTHPGKIFWGSEVTLDASVCGDLNPDYNIVNYEWDFGDGTTDVTSSPSVTHKFNVYDTTVRVTLKITAETGENGTFDKDIHIDALYNAIVNDVKSFQLRTLFFNRPANEIRWTANPKNAAAGYPAIARYEVWRVAVSSTLGGNYAASKRACNGKLPSTGANAPLSGNNYVYVGEVEAGVNYFVDYFDLNSNSRYVYSIRSVDSEGHISPFDNL
jgi:hypothetical protein